MDNHVLFHLFSGQIFSITFWKMALIAIFYSWPLISGRFKAGVLVSYFFAVYWMFSSNRVFWVDVFGGQFLGVFFYASLCIVLLTLEMVSLFRENH